MYVPRRFHNIVADEKQLSDYTEHVEVDAEREEEIPQLQDLI